MPASISLGDPGYFWSLGGSKNFEIWLDFSAPSKQLSFNGKSELTQSPLEHAA
jgi:hypothetical protein